MSVATLPWWAAVPVAVLLVIGGLITATWLTLLVIPALYNRFNLAREVTEKEEI